MNLIDDKELERQFRKYNEEIQKDITNLRNQFEAKIEQIKTTPSTSAPLTPPSSPDLKPEKPKTEEKKPETVKTEPETKPPSKSAEELKKAEQEKANLEKLVKEKADRELKELEAKQKAENEQKAKEKLAKEQAEKLENEKKEAEKLAKEKLEKETREKQELQDLRNDINKLPLNDKEKGDLTNTKDRLEAEKIRTEATDRIARENKQNQDKKEKERIEKLWQPFFTKHEITNPTNKIIWQTQFPNNPDGAEKVYTDAINLNSKSKDRKTALTEPQKKVINLAKNPTEIKDKQKVVKEERTTLKWNDFYNSHNITSESDKNEWKTKYSLKEAKEAQELYDNSLKTIIDKIELSNEEKEMVKKATTPTLINQALKTDIPHLRAKKKEIGKYDALLADINDANKNTFHSLPESHKKSEIEALNNDLLPTDKKKETLTAKIKERRATFHYSLDNVNDGGYSPEQLKKALEAIKENQDPHKSKVWKVQEKKSITVEILNKLLGLTPTTADQVQDLTDYFISKKGYVVSDTVLNAEKAFTGENEWKSGHALLTDCYDRIEFKNAENKEVKFSPERPEEYFCEKPIDPEKGTLPFPTGSGKSSRVPACIYGFAREAKKKDPSKNDWNIIIVAPTASLAKATFDNHDDWLQKNKDGTPWRCPFHLHDHSGAYKTAFNDLTYYDSVTYSNPDPKIDKTGTRIRGQGEKGISVMEPQVLLSYMVRNLIEIRKINRSFPVEEKTKLETAKLAVKAKLINRKETIIYFDESHFAKDGSTTYSKIQELAQSLGHNTMRATATFKDKPFSISMPKKIERKYMSGLVAKYTDKEGKEVDFNAWLVKGKLLVFLPKAELTQSQQEILKANNVGYFVLDETLEQASTSVVRDCPNGYVFFGDDRYGIGFNFKINSCVSLMELEIKNLTKQWNYRVSTQPLTDASLTQQSGRVARLTEGKFVAVGKRSPQSPEFTKNIDATNDLASLMVEVVLSKSKESPAFKKLEKIYGSLTADGLELLQSAVALPFEDNKWRYPEEILIGLTRGGAGDTVYPQFDTKKQPETADKDLWARFKGNYEPKEIDKEQAKQLLFLMVGNTVGNLQSFPKKINWNLESPLIKQIGFTPENKEAIVEIKKVVMGAVAGKIKEPNKVKYNNETEFKKVVELLKLPLHEEKLKIEIVQESTDKLKNPKNPTEGKVLKPNLTLKITYT